MAAASLPLGYGTCGDDNGGIASRSPICFIRVSSVFFRGFLFFRHGKTRTKHGQNTEKVKFTPRSPRDTQCPRLACGHFGCGSQPRWVDLWLNFCHRFSQMKHRELTNGGLQMFCGGVMTINSKHPDSPGPLVRRTVSYLRRLTVRILGDRSPARRFARERLKSRSAVRPLSDGPSDHFDNSFGGRIQ